MFTLRLIYKSFGETFYGIATARKEKIILAAACVLFVLSSGTARAQFTNGQAASYVIGQGTATRSGEDNLDSLGLNQPNGVAVDPTNGQVYIADTYNNRVLRYASAASFTNGSGAIGVLGQPDFHTSAVGYGQNGLNNPVGVVVDRLGNLYVSDSYNGRVMKYSHASSKSNGANADTVFGQADFSTTGYGSGQSGLSAPRGLAVDKAGNLFVADNYNCRVMIFFNAASKGNGAAADLELGQPDFSSTTYGTTQSLLSYPSGVAVDTSGTLYVADNGNNRVLRFGNAVTKSNGANADAVLGQVDFTSTVSAVTQSGLSDPTGVAVDRAGNLFVSDASNERVVKYSSAASKANGANADAVLGQPNFTTQAASATRNGMWYPVAVAIDTSENLYVADYDNNRILRFGNAPAKSNGANADAVLGHATFTDGRQNNLDSIGLNGPCGVAVDPKSGAVYVVDENNNRVLRYTSSSSFVAGHGAIGVLGEPDFGSTTGYLSQSGMFGPTGAAVDTAGNLYIADRGNSRVMIFLKAASKANGANADIILGQPNGESDAGLTTQSGMNEPTAVAVDRAGNLYVSDVSDNRVLKFAHAASKATGANADVVLGQPDFVSNGAATTQTGFSAPRGVAVDPKGNLYVVDYINQRVLKFSNAAAKANGAKADTVFGQTDFVSANYYSTSASSLYYPYGAAVDDAGTLYITDSDNNRMLLYSNAASKGIDASADVVLCQPDFSSTGLGASLTAVNGLLAVAANSSTGTLYLVDYGNNRVMVYTASSPLAVQLYSFTSSLQQAGHVALQWSTATETNNYGFYVERSSTASGPFADLPGNFVAGHGTTLQPQSYSWIDTTAQAGTYYYRLKQVDLTGATSYSKTITIRVSGVEGVKSGANMPKVFSLSQNYPNPFNPSTVIEYALPKSAHVSLRMYNMLGEAVATLVDEDEEAGYTSVRFDGSKLASGVYFYKLTAGSFSSVMKLLLTK